MTDALQQMLERSGATASVLSPTSRYRFLERAQFEVPGGEPITYLRRRFLPMPETLGELVERTVAQGERLDAIAHDVLGDPEQFWRLCDANAVLRPSDLTALPGSSLRVPATGGGRLG